MLKLKCLKIDNMVKQIITDNPNPLFSFQLSSECPDCYINSYRILVKSTSEVVWDSGMVEDGNVLNIPYAGDKLTPYTRYQVSVTVKDNHEEEAIGETSFDTGKLDEIWIGKWITNPNYHFFLGSPKPMVFRKKIQITKKIFNAQLYSTAFGIYECKINGSKVGNDYFAPGYTSYNKQMQYQVYDVTNQLKTENLIHVIVAGGWAVGDFNNMHFNKAYARRQAFLCELRMEYEDGEIEIIGTDESWEVSVEGNYKYADFYNGEIYDARVNDDAIGYKNAAVTKNKYQPILRATYGSMVRRQEQMYPVNRWNSQSGGIIYDFGQNFAGVISAKIYGEEGQKVIITHAEVCLDDELYTKPLRRAKACIEYICKEGIQEYSPKLTYMGFRYIKVEGIAEKDIEITAYALYSEIEKTGDFSCSNEQINQLQSNIIWGGKSNFVDIPTDCPQRDERMGWTGDTAVFASTACYNFDMKRFYDKWLLDVIAEQNDKGGLPDIVPKGKYGSVRTTACWGDSCVIVPWASYQAYGDKELLKRQYSSMKRHITAELKLASKKSKGIESEQYIWRSGFHYGDWCAPGEGKAAWKEKAPWVATAFMANSCRIMSKIAKVLEKDADHYFYNELADKISKSYLDIHTNGEGRLINEFQTGYVLPLYFDMVRGKERERMAYNLAKLVEKSDNHLTTGFCGTPYILFALSDNGYSEKAYDLLLQDTCPSWLYEVKTGGTTVWERWDALTPDGRVNQSGNMVSFNHYAYGAVGDWLYRRVAGIEILEGGYRSFQIKPVIGGNLSWAKGEIQTGYGKIVSDWMINDQFHINVEVPVNTTCHLILPDGSIHILGSGKYLYSCDINK